ncbi:hypothetical protein DFJ73DRAFT_761431 [Zopfochytrium polystomum]|nr:hypothetical protein DFJ73DRAFT_761431 [Zopfochytrium polystomum]
MADDTVHTDVEKEGGLKKTGRSVNAARRGRTMGGNFIQTLINFILISVVVFFLVKLYSAAFLRKKKVEAPTTKDCEECCEKIDVKAKKCKFCCSPAQEYVAPAAEPASSERHGFMASPFRKAK